MKTSYVLLVLIFMVPSIIFGQFFYSGQERASLKWTSFETPHFRVVYTDDISIQAYYYARLLEKNYRYFSVKENLYPQKTSVVMHNRDVFSNGFSVPAPLRMEISTIPSQSVEPQDWLQLLAIHEFRHSLQIEVFRNGFARHLTWLLGDIAVAGAMSRLPFWFIEGEAVHTETAYTHGGRGRNSGFLMMWKALAGADKSYSYDKAVNGSYMDFVPDYYKLGYHLFAHGKKNYPDSLWRYVSRRTANFPFGWRPFSNSLKKVTGRNVDDFYEEMLNELSKEQDAIAVENPSGKLLVNEPGVYSRYQHATMATDGAFYAYRESLQHPGAFVRIDEGKTEIIFEPGNISEEQVTFSGNKVFWTEYFTHPRWTRENYAVIKSYDFQSGKEELITSTTERNFAPDVNDRDQLVTVHFSEAGTPSLKVYQLPDAELVTQKKFTKDKHILTPKWAEDGASVAFVEVTERGKAVKEYFPENGKVLPLFERTVLDISHPVLTNEYLFFVAPFRGRDELYAMKRRTRALFRIASSPYGLNFPSLASGSQIIYSSYDENGFLPYLLDLKKTNWKPVSFPASDPFKSASEISEKEINFSSLPEMSVEKEPHKKTKGLINFHSLTPFGYSKEDMVKGPGVSVHSQNLLSTMFTSAGYFYDHDQDGGTYFTDVEYRGFYPVLKLNASYGKRDGWAENDGNDVFLEWDRYNVSAGLEIPHRFNAGKMQRFFSAGVSTTFRANEINAPDTLSFTYDKVQTVDYKLYFYNLKRRGVRDLYPKYGQIIDLNFVHTPFNRSEVGYLASAEGYFYLPGFANNQYVWLYAGYQYKSEAVQPLSGFVSYPRGYNGFHHDRMFSAKLNYALPLAYPEWNVGPLAYFKRLKGNAFVDYAHAGADVFDDGVLTSGVELIADTHLLRLIAPTQIGVRGIYDLTEETIIFEFLFSMNFNVY